MDLSFYSPDEGRAQRLAARLCDLASVHWEDSRRFSAERWLQHQPRRQLLLLDFAADATSASMALARQLASIAPDVALFGVGSTGTDRASGVLCALRAGVRDYIDMDAGDDELAALLHKALQQAPAGAGQTGPAPAPHGQLVVLLGVRPGMGTSTLAAHLGTRAVTAVAAGAPASETSRALLLDLGHPKGDTALYLGVSSNFHYEDALRNAHRIDSTLIHTALPHHATGLTVMTQPAGSADPGHDSSESRLLVKRLLGMFELVLCDVGGMEVQHIPSGILTAADQIWLIADQAIASVVSLDNCLRELERLGLRDQRLSLVVSHHDTNCVIAATRLADRFQLPLLANLPNRQRALRASANQGLLLQQVAPKDPYLKALTPLLARLRICAQSVRETPTAPWWKHILLRMGGRRWKAP
jgi:pilus assembly protein CpaE